MEYLINIGQQAKEASKQLKKLTSNEKKNILNLMCTAIKNNSNIILESNKKDVDIAQSNGLKQAYIDRLTLDQKRLDDISNAFLQIATLDDPIGEFISMKTMENGLVIGQKRVPLGVIGIIYEARPNVTADAFSLCLKVSSCVVLRGGKEAINTNTTLVNIFRKTLKENNYNENFVQLIEDTSRETALGFMKLNKYIDVLIPRGSASLIDSVVLNSTIPVIETGTGNCHIFVDETADLKKAVDIIVNAKTQRVGVCNACEKLILHKNIANEFLPTILNILKSKGVEVRGDKYSKDICNEIVEAKETDWAFEYLDYIIAIKIVEDIDSAIEHISNYSTGHSEAILTENYANSQKFLNEVDSAAVYVNASTRFTDGFEFGFGAEIGISTQKLHARGPMGLKELTSTKYVIYGTGQIRK